MAEVEQLLEAYDRGRMSRREFARRLTALGIGAGFLQTILGREARAALADAPRQTPLRAPYFVLIVMDAFRADYLNLTPMPNLEALMARGTTFSHAWVGQLESYTPASHATLSTGATPAHQGVLGFEWRDPQTGQEDYTGWYNDVIAGRLEAQLEQHGVNSIPKAVKGQDPNARIVALSSEKYYAADAMGGAAADYILYGLPESTKIVTKGIPHHVPPAAFLRGQGLTQSWPLLYGQFDAMSMTMALESLRAFDPRVLMINLPGTDIYGHRVGGPGDPATMKRIVAAADQQIGRLVTAYRDRGILEQTVFVVTGDHGMVPNTLAVDDSTIKAEIRAAGGDYLFHTGGNSAYIWLRNPEAASRVAQHLVEVIGPAPFAHYQQVESGRYTHHAVARGGTSLDPSLEAAYQYLLGTFAGPLAPDISLAFRENTVTRIHSKGHGEHGGATWGAQAVPLVFAGPGVRSGVTSTFPARLMDVAPTVLTLLGIEPTNMDGVPLADALLAPTDRQLRDQDAVAGPLAAYQRALIAASQADIAAQKAYVAPTFPNDPHGHQPVR